jgi:hypothetical protein
MAIDDQGNPLFHQRVNSRSDIASQSDETIFSGLVGHLYDLFDDLPRLSRRRREGPPAIAHGAKNLFQGKADQSRPERSPQHDEGGCRLKDGADMPPLKDLSSDDGAEAQYQAKYCRDITSVRTSWQSISVT